MRKLYNINFHNLFILYVLGDQTTQDMMHAQSKWKMFNQELTWEEAMGENEALMAG